jgi:hypothetical protein
LGAALAATADAIVDRVEKWKAFDRKKNEMTLPGGKKKAVVGSQS